MADVALLASAVQDTGGGYQVPGAQEIILKCLTVSYDGASAAGSFVPAVQIIAPNGAVMGTFPVTTTVTAGQSVDVSWFPRAGGGINGGGAGIRFDTDNEGGWLTVTANNQSPDFYGIEFTDTSGGGIGFNSDNGGFFVGVESNGDITLQTTVGGGVLIENGNGHGASKFQIVDSDGGGLSITENGNGGTQILNKGTGEFIIADEGGGGLDLVSISGSAGMTLSTQSGSLSYPGSSPTPIVMIANGGTGNAAVICGMHGSDWLSIYDYNSGSPIERFRFFANGNCQMISLPTSATGLDPGSLWNNNNVVNIV